MKYVSSLTLTLIYVIRINDKAHKGCLKIGETTVDEDVLPTDLQPNCAILNKAAKKRINKFTQTAGIAYDLLYTECTLFKREKNLCSFQDHDVHEVLRRSGIKKKVFQIEAEPDEWYITDLETAKKAIAAVKAGKMSLNASEITIDRNPVILRPEQRDAVDKTIARFKKNNRMLWNAKMRFGKTFSALQVVKEEDFQRTLILTHRPVVNDQWFKDFQEIFYDKEDYSFGSKSKGETFENLEKRARKQNRKYVYFASLQDMRGSEKVGGKFDKNSEIFDADWDLVIVDEAHEGTQTELGRNVIAELEKKEPKLLCLSGTPFNLLDDYDNEEIYTWDYVMEQKAKNEWDKTHFGDPNPYAPLPRLNIFTFDLGKMIGNFADEELAFNFHEFFRVNENGKFIHEKDVRFFLNLICKADNDSNYPYSTEEYRRNFRHSLWMVPGVREARALSAMLKAHKVFGQFQIVNVAGEGDEDEENEESLKKVQSAIGANPEDTYTITLSCGRLTTGVSVPAWTAVFMLSGSYNTSASSYMQTIFRVQTPATINGRVKTECFVFDFAPDRTLKVLAETAKISTKAGKTSGGDRQAMGEFLNFCPVIAIDGTRMKTYDVNHMLEQLKKVYVERVVRRGFEDNYLYNNDLLMKLTKQDLSDFDDLKKIIGTTKAMERTGDIDINNQGFTKEEYEELEKIRNKPKKELTKAEQKLLEEKKKKKKQRDTAISILRGISIRMPLMIYGAELKDESQEITIDNFSSLIDQQSWEEFMPRGVSRQKFIAFKKYYEPDVFRAAGKRIRAMAKAADSEPLETRIGLITDIFKTFRNPDKETVLTPWRVVNMHIGDCIGGYRFYDETYDHVLPKPEFVDHGKVTADVFKPDSRILEINSKTGLYPLYMAYSIYRTSLHASNTLGLSMEPTVEQQYELWDKVVAENIFIICKTPMAKSITKRTLLGFRKGKVNAHYFEDIVNTLKNKPQQFISKISRGKFWGLKGLGNMKFDAIIGNPPYQEETAKQQSATNGQAPRTNVFHYYQIAADELNSNITALIYPGARWMHRSGKGMEKFGLKQINDISLKRIDFYPDSQEIFRDVAIADGITMVLKDKMKKTSGFEYVYHRSNQVISVQMEAPGERLISLNPQNAVIVEKISAFIRKYKLSFLHNRILPRSLFGIESDFVEKHPSAVREYIAKERIDYSRDIKLLTTDKAGKSGRAKWFVASKDIIPQDSQKYLKEWQVIVSSANAGGQKRDNQISIADNHSAFGRVRVALGSFKTQKEAENFYKYAQTAIIRFMFLMTDESLTSLGKRVPDIGDYSDKNTWIDFSGDLNSQLYALFGIEQEEIAFIESMLRPME